MATKCLRLRLARTAKDGTVLKRGMLVRCPKCGARRPVASQMDNRMGYFYLAAHGSGVVR